MMVRLQRIQLAKMPERYQPSPIDSAKLLGDDELHRFNKSTSVFVRRRLVYGRFLLRKMLSTETKYEVKPEEWKFIRSRYGKPMIDPSTALPSIKFSLSYSEKVVAIAISRDTEIGIDIEAVGESDISVMTSALSEREQQLLAAYPSKECHRKLIQIWTIKEAYTKMLGLGGYIDFSTLTVSPSAHPTLIDNARHPNELKPMKFKSTLLSLCDQDYFFTTAVMEV